MWESRKGMELTNSYLGHKPPTTVRLDDMPASFKLIDPVAGEKGETANKIITNIQHFLLLLFNNFIQV